MKGRRRCLLFTPGNNPAMILACQAFAADAVILDLEDAVAVSQKDAARHLVIEALRTIDYRSTEKVVRINPLSTPYGLDDLEAVMRSAADTVLLAKAEPESLREVADILSKSGSSLGIIALIESARGLEGVSACASVPMVNGIFFGAEDFTADIGAQRGADGLEILYARQRIVVSAAAAGIDSIDTPFVGLDDGPELERDVTLTRRLGFSGKACISPRHVDTILRMLSPSQEEIEWARRVTLTARDAAERGLGAISLEGRMIDAPIVTRATRVLERAGMAMEGNQG